MGTFLGIDTSNYTTSVSLVKDHNVIYNLKLPVSVKSGDRGIRQSDAVFQHIKNLPLLMDKLGGHKLDAIGVSASPRNVENSYMPCFLSGVAVAKSISDILGIDCYKYSHQQGHVASALFSCNKFELISENFIAFHISGGTTEILFSRGKNISKIGGTKDVNVGQLIDRIGVRLGMSFPCGPEIEKTASLFEEIKGRKQLVNGLYCNLSGLENQCYNSEYPDDKSYVSSFLLKSIALTLEQLLCNVVNLYPGLQVIFSGGVMSNVLIKNYILEKYPVFFAQPEFSSDNAAGIALLTEYDWLINNDK